MSLLNRSYSYQMGVRSNKIKHKKVQHHYWTGPFFGIPGPHRGLEGPILGFGGPEVDNLGFGPYKCTMAIFANFGHFYHCCPNLSWHLKINEMWIIIGKIT